VFRELCEPPQWDGVYLGVGVSWVVLQPPREADWLFCQRKRPCWRVVVLLLRLLLLFFRHVPQHQCHLPVRAVAEEEAVAEDDSEGHFWIYCC